MHRFVWCPTDERVGMLDPLAMYLVGADGVPVRGTVTLADDEIHCQVRAREPFGLSLLWPVAGFGTVQLETPRLPLRDRPYNLHVELARDRLMRLTLKREEWGLFDYPGLEEITAQTDQARDLFIAALQAADDASTAARLADQSLALSLSASERLARFHASIFLGRRQQSGGFARSFIGVALPPGPANTALLPRVREAFEFVRLPFVWREIQPSEHDTRYDAADAWVQACTAARLSIRGGPLLRFGVRDVPDWMYIWENDFDTVLELAREHVRRTVQRYANQVTTWFVASGLHADNVFSLGFEQIIEMTRMAATVARQLAPRSQIVLDLVQPWGEYYARNQRTIPPMLYAELAVQSGINFDAFGLQFLFGIDGEGYHLRDLFQISALIDRIANLGKPLHISALAVPSTSPNGGPGVRQGGRWYEPWSEETQAEWLVAACEIALSKPYVESVCLHALADGRADGIPSAGVLRADLTPKPALTRLGALSKQFQCEPAR